MGKEEEKYYVCMVLYHKLSHKLAYCSVLKNGKKKLSKYILINQHHLATVNDE